MSRDSGELTEERIHLSSLHLRRATLTDAVEVRELTRSAYAPWVELIGREPKPMTVDYEQAVREHIVDIHEDNGRIGALIELVQFSDHLLIENVAVHPEHHGKGLGGALMKHAEAVAMSLGLAELRLYTNAAFVSNLAFYSKRGFVESLREPIASGGELVRMQKQLRF